jgi:hypothetical protein
MAETTPPQRTSLLALAAFVLGLAAVPLLAAAGVPALVVGFRGLRAVNGSDGRLRGAGLALAGMVLGALSVVVTVLGLGAMVVNRVRDRSLRVECQDHLRRIGLAVAAHVQENKAFPRGAVPNADLPPEKRLSWIAGLLPYLASDSADGKPFEALDERIDRRAAWDAPSNQQALDTPFPAFLCPANPDYNPRQRPGRTSYVGLSGIGPDAAALPKTSPRAGILGYERTVTPDDLAAGSSYTMFATETAKDNGAWLAAGFATLREINPRQEHLIGPGRPFGGLHRGGLYVLWADGSARWLADAVPPDDFRAQCTLAGKSPE